MAEIEGGSNPKLDQERKSAGKVAISMFVRRFEGDETLDNLLARAGSTFTAAKVRNAFSRAIAQGETPASIIPTFFEAEPRFSDPADPGRLYGNLLGLWDRLLAQPDSGTSSVPARDLLKKPIRPPPYGPEGPEAAFVELAWRYLQDLDNRTRKRMEDSFENKQATLIDFIENAGLTDRAFLQVRYLVFELAAMIELGYPPGLRSVAMKDLGNNPPHFPPALSQYAEEALFESEQDEEEPLSQEEARRAREVVSQCAGALWSARRNGK
jgi:hypothetical protein